jgi:hypothetical protein
MSDVGRELPPADYDGVPHAHLLPTGTVLWRVHSAHRAPADFKPGGLARGRFDGGAEDPYGSLYLAFDEVTALIEVLLRNIDFGRRGFRHVQRHIIANRRLSAVRTTDELRLIDLSTGDALAAVCQDAWLIHCGESDFTHTRAWARWLRATDEKAAGMVWTTRRNLVQRSVVLFADRTTALEPAGLPQIDLEPRYVNAVLRRFRARVEESDSG